MAEKTISCSPARNRTLASRATGGYTYHYTTGDDNCVDEHHVFSKEGMFWENKFFLKIVIDNS